MSCICLSGVGFLFRNLDLSHLSLLVHPVEMPMPTPTDCATCLHFQHFLYTSPTGVSQNCCDLRAEIRLHSGRLALICTILAFVACTGAKATGFTLQFVTLKVSKRARRINGLSTCTPHLPASWDQALPSVIHARNRVGWQLYRPQQVSEQVRVTSSSH